MAAVLVLELTRPSLSKEYHYPFSKVKPSGNFSQFRAMPDNNLILKENIII
jgi:hypothetical protein